MCAMKTKQKDFAAVRFSLNCRSLYGIMTLGQTSKQKLLKQREEAVRLENWAHVRHK